MEISYKSNPNSDFQTTINHNLIDRTNNVKYLGVYLNSDLTWKTHLDNLAKKLSKVCGMIHKLCYFVPTATLKVVYSVFQHALPNYNWEEHVKVTNINYLFYSSKS